MDYYDSLKAVNGGLLIWNRLIIDLASIILNSSDNLLCNLL